MLRRVRDMAGLVHLALLILLFVLHWRDLATEASRSPLLLVMFSFGTILSPGYVVSVIYTMKQRGLMANLGPLDDALLIAGGVAAAMATATMWWIIDKVVLS